MKEKRDRMKEEKKKKRTRNIWTITFCCII